MKKTILMAVAGLFAMTACNQQAPKVDEKSEAAPTNSELKIAFVEVDSIMSQYEFCKEYSKILEKKGQNIQNTIAQKGQNLQAAANKFQQDLQNNKYTQQQAEAVNAGLQKQQADLQALQQRLGSDFQAETDKFNAALRDSIQHFLAKYNKDKKYSLILSKAGDNILFADKAYDVTNEVIAGLNKAYKKNTAKKEEKKEETAEKK
ncbi:MAG: OmpH family outer membrane protein [Prevotella sp.]|jgi:outer membrane protein|nr:OmpH family outer membrane protein [Prevotella sp.]MBQ9224268.1 OmpH family outer membrane protein [Prevotella sp.]MBR0524894.1 OmpH family outer membrane protein [Prevotella sp.]